MPYSDPAKQRAAQAKWYREKYAKDRKFRHAESDRKADWFQNKMETCNRQRIAKGKS